MVQQTTYVRRNTRTAGEGDSEELEAQLPHHGLDGGVREVLVHSLPNLKIVLLDTHTW